MRRVLTMREGEIAVEGEPLTPLLDVLRKQASRLSVVRGCADASCGACRVIVEGVLTASCTCLLRDVPERARIETYEDVASEPIVAAVVHAFEDERTTRCRLCVGALGVTAHSLYHSEIPPNADAIEVALERATCMCTGRGSLRRALTKPR